MEYLKIMDDEKYGGLDFSISAVIGGFTLEQIKDFRSMCVVAIREADNMWMREQERGKKLYCDKCCESLLGDMGADGGIGRRTTMLR